MFGDSRGRACAADEQHAVAAEVMHEQPLDDPALVRGEHRRSALTRLQSLDATRAQPIQQVEDVRSAGDDTRQIGAVEQSTALERRAQLRLGLAEVQRHTGGAVDHGSASEQGFAQRAIHGDSQTNSTPSTCGTMPAALPSARNRSIASRPRSP